MQYYYISTTSCKKDSKVLCITILLMGEEVYHKGACRGCIALCKRDCKRTRGYPQTDPEDMDMETYLAPAV